MARITIDTDMKVTPECKPGTLMIYKDSPPFVVMSTGIVMGDEFPGVSLEDGAYGEQWVITEFNVFDGRIVLEQ